MNNISLFRIKLKKLFLIILAILIVNVGCSKDDDKESNKKIITSFSFNQFTPDMQASINEIDSVISVKVPYGTDLSALVATFTKKGKNVKVNGVKQKSGETANNFTNSLVYTVKAKDGSKRDYTVTVDTLPRYSIVMTEGVPLALTADDDGKLLSLNKGEALLKLPAASNISSVKYSLVDETVAPGSSTQVIVNPDSIVKLEFDNTGSDYKVIEYVLDLSSYTMVEEQDSSGYKARYIVAFYDTTGNKWIPLTLIGPSLSDVIEKKAISGQFRINSASSSGIVTLIKETNYIKNNGTISFDSLFVGDSGNYGFWTLSAPYYEQFHLVKNSGYPYFYRGSCELGYYINDAESSPIYYESNIMYYYVYDEQKRYLIKSVDADNLTASYNEGADITFDSDEDIVIQVNLTNSAATSIDGYIEVKSHEGIMYKQTIGTTRTFDFIVPRYSNDVTIFCSEYDRYDINFNPNYDHDSITVDGEGRDVFAENITLRSETSSSVHEDSSTMTEIFSFTDPADAADGAAGPGYYNYPVTHRVNSDSFDLRSLKITEGVSTYQFEIEVDKPITADWIHQFDIYMEIAGQGALKTNAIIGKNLTFADGYNKVIYAQAKYSRATMLDYVDEINPTLSSNLVIPHLKEQKLKSFVFTVSKTDLGGADLSTDLNSIQCVVSSLESITHVLSVSTFGRCAYDIDNSDERYWNFWFDGSDEGLADGVDYDDINVTHPFIPAAQTASSKSLPFCTDILNGRDSTDTLDIANDDLDDFSTVLYAEIHMIKAQ